MSRTCDICKKGLLYGKAVSHSNRRTNRRWLPNLQKVKAIVNGAPKTIRVCTTCLKSGKVQRAL
ncbi:large subunit ribosomal protein L28 [Caldicoprobacter guelmensis]|uniref:50S ribosomal protein L28 n=1 Tax=Caldicoprobacter guelmensis TaxID=1170224 RepID=UPI00195A37B4|nr:50S ribosomal protein L28 [Caldicoprobacter guelmensis]MBM7581906.1 large subunit ribosomal protein L28 [Caldicoprobacter guelmensis]